MLILSLLIFFGSLFFSNQQPNPPHGPDFKISCNTCHSSKGWQLDKEIYSFDHNTTKMPLVGQHTIISCRQCHPSLVFAEAKTSCNDCHKDVHQATAGLDCSRCHTTESWLVNNINEIHRMSRFPLLGAHRTADCSLCHKSESLFRFDVVNVNCINCHREIYLAATKPNHIQSGFSEDCSYCHSMNAFEWSGGGFSHSFFPLLQGHAIPKCVDCHTSGSYSDTPTDCYACHLGNYNSTAIPDHQALGFSTACEHCHTTSPEWRPAGYPEHDSQYFPVYSGRHRGKWNYCNDCHINASNYSVFDCITCHIEEHRGKNYTNTQCYNCHPRGVSD